MSSVIALHFDFPQLTPVLSFARFPRQSANIDRMWNFMAGAWPAEEGDEDLAYTNACMAISVSVQ